MALSKEDKKDVSDAYGKALANKVSKVTRDAENASGSASTRFGIRKKAMRIKHDIERGDYVRLKPTQSHTSEDKSHRQVYSPFRRGDERYDDFKTPSHRGLKISPEHSAEAKHKKFTNSN